MSWWNAKYTNGDGDNEITFGSKYYERAKAVEKVCQAVIDKKVKTPDDVAVVVRCKDCKHKGWVQEPCHGKSVDYCKIWDCTLRNLETTFCSYGERKDSGDG